MPPAAATAYSYACVDRSPLVQPFCRWVVRWFVLGMPAAVPANLLTLGSSACMWVMLGLATTAAGVTILAPWCTLLMAGYVIYDHADGMQARRTGTSGPLGEFLDHYTDAFHGAIALVVMFLVAGRAGSPLLVTGLWLLGLAGAATMVEERERKELYFGFIGPLEGMLLTIGFFASWCGDGAGGWWHAPLAGEVTLFGAAMIVGAAGSLLTAGACVRRIGRVPADLAAFALAGAVLGGLAMWRAGAWWEPVLLLTLHGSDYTGRVIAAHLRGTVRARPDWLAPLVMVVAAAGGLPWSWAVGLAAAWLLTRNAALVAGFLRVFGHHWRWRNPATEPSP